MKKISILLFVVAVVVLHFSFEFIYRLIAYSIRYGFDLEKIERMTINMSAYHIIFNFFQIPVLLILFLNIKNRKLLFFVNFLFVLLMCIFWLKSGVTNNVWYLKFNFSLSLASFVIFLLSLVYIPRFMKN